ncbi:MAG: valine--tRNA ligase [Nanoarchaeota archaeon]|nr:valine--tRNA ligase [Nanoarchaeota archaeon]
MKLKEIKNWSPEIEKKITQHWTNSEQFKFNSNTKKPIYSIDTPPPYVNTTIHIGHAITYSYMDFFARYKRMKGFEVLFPLGIDRNGIPIEIATEKKFKISPFKLGRDKFIEYCKKLLEETTSESIDTFSRLGISFNSYNEGDKIGEIYLTDSPEYRTLTQNTFIDLFRKELIYEDTRINNYDPKLQTTIADSEIEYKEISSIFNYIKFKVKETGKEIIIGTTRPELICTCGMIIYNQKDKRYQSLNGKTAITPIFGKEVPIREHPLAEIEKGTGLAMMCSAGDLSDIQFFREMNLKPTIAINKDGTMNEHAGLLQGLKIKEARKKIIGELKKENLLVKQEQIMHRTPLSERSGAEIEFIEMSEFYLKQLDFKKEVQKIANKINFYPLESKKILESWLDSISIDWPISRRRFYATPIPLWRSGALIALPEKGKYYEPWKESVPQNAEVFENGSLIGKVKDFPDKKWQGETRVFDTWFDSSISELNIIKYPSTFSKKAYPVSLRAQGKEIVRTWLYYTLLRGYFETKKPAFKDVWIHQHILDAKGRKMSKSLNNIIDPQDILKNEGAEVLRLWSIIEGDITKQDLSFSRERIKAELKTINKILNVAKFVTQFKKPKPIPKHLTKTDKLFIDYIEELTKFTDEHYDQYDFHYPALKLRHFLWETFASHYIELTKNRAYNKENKFTKTESLSAHYTLHYLLERFLTLMYPIIPQLTTVIGKELKIKFNEYPKIKKTKTNISPLVNRIIQFNKEIWKKKKDQGISLRAEIKNIKIPKYLKDFEKDLRACHGLN